ncbi:MAG: PDZ domain-containing protein [Planctomycetota bacterium]|nr:MAG: PDZ domain-containing protein [Planctomycetota bacterium]
MHRRPLSLLLLAVGLALGLALGLAAPARGGRPSTPAQLLEFSDALEDLAARVLRATVHIRVDFTADGERRAGTGTGFVVDAIRGIVVTNNHVVNPPKDRPDQEIGDVFARVTLADGRVFPADIVAADPRIDIAVVRIPEGEARRQLPWGDSDALRPGALVLAVGNPLGLVGSTSLGVISGLNRSIGILAQTPGGYEDFLQHDAVIDQGSSGGPLVDMRGRVVGVNTAISPDSQFKAVHGLHSWNGVSWSVPARLARKVAEDLVEYGRVRRGYLGVNTDQQEISPGFARRSGLPRPYGALVTEILEGTPAAAAGVRKGDIILEVDGHEVTGWQALRARISAYSPGDRVRLRLWRNKQALEVEVELAELPAEAGG